MRRHYVIRPDPMIARLLAGVVFAILAVPLAAQFKADSQRGYNPGNEINLTGTISAVRNGARPRMNSGADLVLTTLSGSVDVSLGRWGLHGKDAPVLTVGQQVELVGEMRTLNDKTVFFARTLSAGGKTYTIRNEHGSPISPHARERAGAQRGGSL